jgi:hypothetical protein
MLRLGTAGFAGSIGDSFFFFLTTRSIRTNFWRAFSRSRVPKPVPPPPHPHPRVSLAKCLDWWKELNISLLFNGGTQHLFEATTHKKYKKN